MGPKQEKALNAKIKKQEKAVQKLTKVSNKAQGVTFSAIEKLAKLKAKLPTAA